MFEFVARPAPLRIGLMVLGSLAFVALGAWIAGLFGPDRPDAPAWFGWVAMGFFGLCGAVLIRRLFDREDMVRIGAPGIWIRGVANGQAIPWSAIAAIGIWEHKRQKVFTIKLHDPAHYPAEGLAAMLASANKALTGADLVFSLTGTDRSFDEGCAVIDRYWQQGNRG